MNTTRGSASVGPLVASGEGPAVGRRLRRGNVWVALLALGAAVWALLGSAWIFPQLSANSDEGIYLLQADTLRAGDLSPATPDAEPDAFLPWFSTIEGDRYIFKYTPVHATLLAAGDTLPGPNELSLAVLAAAQVLIVAALARELGLDDRSVAIAAALFALSPLVLQLEITYLPYGTSLVLGIAALTLVLRAGRLRSDLAAAAGGMVWGFALFARPYDGVLLLLIITTAVWTTRRSAMVRTAAAGAIGAVLPLVLLLAFNHTVTGDAFQLPFNLLETADRLGFGERRALPGDAFVDFGPHESVSALGRNLLLVTAWTGGGLFAVATGAWALARGRLPRGPILAVIVVWPLGYALFWGSYLTAFIWDGALFLGPYYYLPLVPAVSIAAAVGIADLFRLRRNVGVAAVAAMAVLGLAVIVPALDDQLARSSQREAMAAQLEAAVDGPALVLLPPVYGPYLQNPFSFLRNTPAIDGDVVYALQRDAAGDERVQTLFPDRTAYRVTLPRNWSDQPGFDPVIVITRIDAPETVADQS